MSFACRITFGPSTSDAYKLAVAALMQEPISKQHKFHEIKTVSWKPSVEDPDLYRSVTKGACERQDLLDAVQYAATTIAQRGIEGHFDFCITDYTPFNDEAH